MEADLGEEPESVAGTLSACIGLNAAEDKHPASHTDLNFRRQR